MQLVSRRSQLYTGEKTPGVQDFRLQTSPTAPWHSTTSPTWHAAPLLKSFPLHYPSVKQTEDDKGKEGYG